MINANVGDFASWPIGVRIFNLSYLVAIYISSHRGQEALQKDPSSITADHVDASASCIKIVKDEEFLPQLLHHRWNWMALSF